MKTILKLIICIAVCQLAGVIGSFFTMESGSIWYTALNKPALNPPNWIFAPVWITLYTLMGISLFLVINKGLSRPGVKSSILFFAIQLLLNGLWSIIFFGMHLILAALIIIIMLWIFILMCIIKFKRVSPVAAYLLVPYILWVSFAAYLNYSLYVSI
jgi:benzodiazapine receptor